MLETEQGTETGAETPEQTETPQSGAETPKRTTARRRTRRAAKSDDAGESPDNAASPDHPDSGDSGDNSDNSDKTSGTTKPKKKVAKSTKRAARPAKVDTTDTTDNTGDTGTTDNTDDTGKPDNADSAGGDAGGATVEFQPPSLLFQQPDLSAVASPTDEVADAEPTPKSRRRRSRSTGSDEPATDPAAEPASQPESQPAEATEAAGESEATDDDDEESGGSRRRRRRRGGRRRGKAEGEAGTDDGSESAEGKPDAAGAGAESGTANGAESTDEDSDSDDDESKSDGGSRRRRRRRRRKGEPVEPAPDDPETTVVKVREPRKAAESSVSSVEGSTRLEAKRQRRREGRDAGRRRPPILTEAEFLTRRESVERAMVIRQRGDVTQIAVLEDNVLVEHYVARQAQTSLIGNVYLGRVQNVLPSMEAAFIDIGRGRNAVLYAGEVDWAGLGVEGGQARRIESALKSGQTVPVQVTKDPVGHKGARLTSQISLAGRYLVYVPHGSMNGISRKLPDTERSRLKQLLKDIVDDQAGVVVRTAAEGASEEELGRDVSRLRAQWETIDKKAQTAKAPELLYAEPDLLIKVVRDLFTEDFAKLVISGDDAWDMVGGYVGHVAPHLTDRLEKWSSPEDIYAAFRIDEQIMKALDRKVWLPSGGSLIIERTEAMTVIDVNTGKFTGSGGNLEETVTKNNLEAAEEIVRQLRLRDIGGIIVVDFIDMVLESNRELVLRRLVECLGRDRTKHQVAEVTSLGLVQMTRKRIGTGLLEAFSEPCEHCKGRGHVVHVDPLAPAEGGAAGGTSGSNGSGGGNGGSSDSSSDEGGGSGRRSRRRRRGGSKSGSGNASDSASEPAGEDSAEPADQQPAQQSAQQSAQQPEAVEASVAEG